MHRSGTSSTSATNAESWRESRSSRCLKNVSPATWSPNTSSWSGWPTQDEASGPGVPSTVSSRYAITEYTEIFTNSGG